MENFENQIDSMNGARRQNRPLKVRCPDCFQQFSVNPEEIAEAKPRFECTSCQTQFWIAFPEALEQSEVIGFPLEWLNTPGQRALEDSSELPPLGEDVQPSDNLDPKNDQDSQKEFLENLPQVKFREENSQLAFVEDKEEEKSASAQELGQFQCPKCSEPINGGAEECGRCGVIINAFLEAQRTERFPLSHPVGQKLKDKWEWVLGNYEDKETHQDFFKSALKENQLEFALGKYMAILDAHSGDEMANKMKNQIEALAIQRSLGNAQAAKSARNQPRTGWRKKMGFRWSSMVIFGCSIVIGMGYFIPTLRNLMGIGVSVLFITLALRYQLKSL